MAVSADVLSVSLLQQVKLLSSVCLFLMEVAVLCPSVRVKLVQPPTTAVERMSSTSGLTVGRPGPLCSKVTFFHLILLMIKC